MAPKSRALRKDKPAATAASFTAEEWERIDSDIKSWVSEIKREENARLFHDPEAHPGVEDHLPPVRGSDSCPHSGKVGLSGIGSIDWDKGGDCDLQGYISPVDQSKPL